MLSRRLSETSSQTFLVRQTDSLIIVFHPSGTAPGSPGERTADVQEPLMKRFPLTTGVAALGVLLFTTPAAKAELIPWMYNWSRSPSEIKADAPGTGYITLTDE